MASDSLIAQPGLGLDLERIVPGGVTENEDLRKLSRWRIGGRASWVVEPSSTDEVSALIRYLAARDLPMVVIGDGSNLLFDDEGLDAVVIRIGRKISAFSIHDERVVSQAGVWIPRLARNVAARGFAGMQHTIGIPGTLGGLVCMNGGSQRRGIGDNVINVTAVMPDGSVKVFDRSECEFSYRESIFQNNQAVITEAVLGFERSDSSEMRREMLEIMHSRRTRFPLKLPNCGSVFVSDPSMYKHIGPPGKAIEDSGLKGARVGDAQVSPFHANFIVNLGKASSHDVLSLVQKIRQTVFDRTNYSMNCEVRHVSRHGRVQIAHESAEALFGRI